MVTITSMFRSVLAIFSGKNIDNSYFALHGQKLKVGSQFGVVRSFYNLFIEHIKFLLSRKQFY